MGENFNSLPAFSSVGDFKTRLRTGRYLETVMNAYDLTIMDFSDEEVNHMIDLLLINNRNKALEEITLSCLRRKVYSI